MRALVLDDGRLDYRTDVASPQPGADEVVVRVTTAGVCATDLALARGYMSFAGVPGHEFVGVAETGALAGKRVVGDINAACGECVVCARGDRHHCPQRTVLGIVARSGAFAERLCLPAHNLLVVPDAVSNDAAVFVEPLAAAFEIAKQVELLPAMRTLVIGDGKLGLLCAHVLALAGTRVVVAGRHPERAALLPESVELRSDLWSSDRAGDRGFDVVVEASGQPTVVADALDRVRPRGTLVLKTTTERASTLDLSRLVVDEISLVGSRCGPFDRALAALAERRVDVEPLIAARYPLADGRQAFEHAARRGTLKVLVDVAG